MRIHARPAIWGALYRGRHDDETAPEGIATSDLFHFDGFSFLQRMSRHNNGKLHTIYQFVFKQGIAFAVSFHFALHAWTFRAMRFVRRLEVVVAVTTGGSTLVVWAHNGRCWTDVWSPALRARDQARMKRIQTFESG